MESKPYGNVNIEKIECVGHVQKRMKGQRLSDGKSLEGMGRLTDKQIDKIQNQYGNAIRRNKNNIEKMREHV